jgi:ABC-2 type transport system permease protein
VRKPGETAFGTYDLYVRGKLDDRVEDEIRDGLRHAIVEARVRHAGLDRGVIESLTQVRRQRSITVTATGERTTNTVVNAFLPFAFMGLIMLGVMTSGQSLMTSMVEEKSSRVIEVLLSAVSPMQLMAGKILGQLAVGALLMVVYVGLGMWAILAFAVAGLVDPMLFVYMVVFFLLAAIMVGSLMAAIGASVNQLSEAQSLNTPVMLMIMIPYMLWLPITRNPNSTFSVVVSMLPPVNCFTMMLRLTSSTPPPLWQVLVSIAIGIAGVFAAVWFASKVFRVGLLMYGKPPNFATLVRWARMA